MTSPARTPPRACPGGGGGDGRRARRRPRRTAGGASSATASSGDTVPSRSASISRRRRVLVHAGHSGGRAADASWRPHRRAMARYVRTMNEVKGCTSTGRRRMLTSLVPVVIAVGLLGACGSDDKSDNTAASTPSTESSATTPRRWRVRPRRPPRERARRPPPGRRRRSPAPRRWPAAPCRRTTTGATGQYTVVVRRFVVRHRQEALHHRSTRWSRPTPGPTGSTTSSTRAT